MLAALARVTQPHLSKMIGSNRPLAIDWLDDPKPRPPSLPFDPMDKSYRRISPGIKVIISARRGKLLASQFTYLCSIGG